MAEKSRLGHVNQEAKRAPLTKEKYKPQMHAPRDQPSPATFYLPTVTTQLIHVRGPIHSLGYDSYNLSNHFTSESSCIVSHSF